MRFVFVHGGFHAGWCWDRTIAELDRMGHDAVAVDLPGHGARVDDPLEEWTIPRRRDAILEAGCSPVMCWSATPAVGSTRPWPPTPRSTTSATSSISRPRYRAKAGPIPRRWRCATARTASSTETSGRCLSYLHFDDTGAMTFADFHGAWRYFYHDCDEATARWAFERLGPEKFGAVNDTPVSVPQFWAAELPAQFHPLHSTTGRCPDGWPTPSPSVSVSSS